MSLFLKLLLLKLTITLDLAVPDDKTFCWKDSYGRGVGKIPTGCPSGYRLEAGLCYEPCKV